MNKISIQYFNTSPGELILGSIKNELCLCDWRYRKMRHAIDIRLQKGLDAFYEEEDTPLLQDTKAQINEYLEGNRQIFDIPLKMVGSNFQQSVWNELLNIPYGKTETYLGLSRKLNNEMAIRAVASANGANAISLFIPCHRITGSKGELVGYAGGLAVKKKLLQLENPVNSQLELF